MTQKDSQSAELDFCGQIVRLASSEVRLQLKLGDDGDRKLVVEVDEFTLARKVAKYVVRCPYRIPTQVGEEKILRRTG